MSKCCTDLIYHWNLFDCMSIIYLKSEDYYKKKEGKKACCHRAYVSHINEKLMLQVTFILHDHKIIGFSF